QIEEKHPPAGVALGQRDDEAEIRFEQMVLGTAPVRGDHLKLAAQLRDGASWHVELVFGEKPRLDALRELDLLLGIEQRDLADLLEVVLYRIRGRARLPDLRGRL